MPARATATHTVRNNAPTPMRAAMLAITIGAILGTLLAACGSNSVEDIGEYREWLNDPGNGLVRQRHAKGLTLTAKYLPPELLAGQELLSLERYSPSRRDSVIASYGSSVSFLLTIAPDEGGSRSDVMMRGVGDPRQFTQRMMALSFDMQQYVTLRVDGRVYAPALAVPDNDYGVSGARTIVFSFAGADLPRTLERAGSIDLAFDDKLLETGISHFIFSAEDIRSRPAFTP